MVEDEEKCHFARGMARRGVVTSSRSVSTLSCSPPAASPITLAAERAGDEMADGVLLLRRLDEEVRAHQAAQPAGDRRREMQAFRLVAHVELPAQGGDGVAAAEKEIVLRRVEAAAAAAVGDLEMQDAVAAPGRAEQDQLGDGFRLLCLVEIGDDLVVRVGDVENEVDLGFDPLVAESHLAARR